MHRLKRLFAFLTLLSLMLIFANMVSAGSNRTQTSFAGGLTTAIAEKFVSTDTYHDYVNCSTYSYTQYPSVDITHIGYNTFSCNSYADFGNVYWTSPTGSVDHDDWHQSEFHATYAPGQWGCSRDGVAAGSHDFGHFDGTSYNWDPSLSAQETFYP